MIGGMDHFGWGGYGWDGFGPGVHFPWVWPLLLIFWFSFGHRVRARGRQRAMRHYDPPAALPPAAPDPALDSLRERFARGAIDRAESEERRAILLSRPPVAVPKSAAMLPTAPQESRPEWPDLS